MYLYYPRSIYKIEMAPTLNNSLLFEDSKPNPLVKSAMSYCGIEPSKQFTIEQYDMYLECATPEELELDIIFESTYRYVILGRPRPPYHQSYTYKNWISNLNS